MAAHHVPVRLLELETTESAIMIDPQRPHQLPEEFSAPEIRILLDDFASDTPV
jgi:EAL domain-containing protein (putative c-di-GMP-specific phosphodiesterase class I)